MSRIPLTDGSGHWFDPAKAERFNDDTLWDGHNHISLATGSQWVRETLYRTAGSRWIVISRTAIQGDVDSVTEISADDAARWLVRNNHDAHPAVAAEYAALEIP